MANYQNTVNDPNASTALGTPSLAAGDTLEFFRYGTRYTSGADFSATDLLKVTLGPDFDGTFRSADGAPLKLTSNRTSTGAFWNRSRSPRTDLISTSSTGVIYKIHMAGTGGLYVATCKPNGIYSSSGLTDIAGDVDVTTIEADLRAQVQYRKTTGAFAATTIKVAGDSIVLIENDFATLNQYGGRSTFGDSSITPGNVNLFGGVCEVLDSGTIGAMALENCTIDWSRMRQAVTVSGTTSVGPGVKIRYKRGGYTPTWTLSYKSTDPVIEYVD